MKVFKSAKTAKESKTSKESFYLNSVCPYREGATLCGNWCALFYFYRGEKTEYSNTSSHVILGCKAGEKLLYVSELVGD